MKEIDVKLLNEEDMKSNLEIEENIEFNNWKESLKGYSKVVWMLVFIVFVLYILTSYAISIPNIEEMRKENLKNAIIYQSWAIITRDKYQKVVDNYNNKIRNAEWCIEANSHTWVVSDCFIFNK